MTHVKTNKCSTTQMMCTFITISCVILSVYGSSGATNSTVLSEKVPTSQLINDNATAPFEKINSTTVVTKHKFKETTNIINCTSVSSIDNSTATERKLSSTAGVSKHKPSAVAPKHKSAAEVLQHNSPAVAPKHKSAAEVLQHNSPAVAPKHKSAAEVLQHNSPAVAPKHKSAAEVLQHNSLAVAPKSKSSAVLTKHNPISPLNKINSTSSHRNMSTLHQRDVSQIKTIFVSNKTAIVAEENILIQNSTFLLKDVFIPKTGENRSTDIGSRCLLGAMASCDQYRVRVAVTQIKQGPDFSKACFTVLKYFGRDRPCYEVKYVNQGIKLKVVQNNDTISEGFIPVTAPASDDCYELRSRSFVKFCLKWENVQWKNNEFFGCLHVRFSSSSRDPKLIKVQCMSILKKREFNLESRNTNGDQYTSNENCKIGINITQLLGPYHGEPEITNPHPLFVGVLDLDEPKLVVKNPVTLKVDEKLKNNILEVNVEYIYIGYDINFMTGFRGKKVYVIKERKNSTEIPENMIPVKTENQPKLRKENHLSKSTNVKKNIKGSKSFYSLLEISGMYTKPNINEDSQSPGEDGVYPGVSLENPRNQSPYAEGESSDHSSVYPGDRHRLRGKQNPNKGQGQPQKQYPHKVYVQPRKIDPNEGGTLGTNDIYPENHPRETEKEYSNKVGDSTLGMSGQFGKQYHNKEGNSPSGKSKYPESIPVQSEKQYNNKGGPSGGNYVNPGSTSGIPGKPYPSQLAESPLFDRYRSRQDQPGKEYTNKGGTPGGSVVDPEGRPGRPGLSHPNKKPDFTSGNGGYPENGPRGTVKQHPNDELVLPDFINIYPGDALGEHGKKYDNEVGVSPEGILGKLGGEYHNNGGLPGGRGIYPVNRPRKPGKQYTNEVEGLPVSTLGPPGIQYPNIGGTPDGSGVYPVRSPGKLGPPNPYQATGSTNESGVYSENGLKGPEQLYQNYELLLRDIIDLYPGFKPGGLGKTYNEVGESPVNILGNLEGDYPNDGRLPGGSVMCHGNRPEKQPGKQYPNEVEGLPVGSPGPPGIQYSNKLATPDDSEVHPLEIQSIPEQSYDNQYAGPTSEIGAYPENGLREAEKHYQNYELFLRDINDIYPRGKPGGLGKTYNEVGESPVDILGKPGGKYRNNGGAFGDGGKGVYQESSPGGLGKQYPHEREGSSNGGLPGGSLGQSEKIPYAVEETTSGRSCNFSHQLGGKEVPQIVPGSSSKKQKSPKEPFPSHDTSNAIKINNTAKKVPNKGEPDQGWVNGVPKGPTEELPFYSREYTYTTPEPAYSHPNLPPNNHPVNPIPTETQSEVKSKNPISTPAPVPWSAVGLPTPPPCRCSGVNLPTPPSVRWAGVNLPTPPHVRWPGVNLPTPPHVRWPGVNLPTPPHVRWSGVNLPITPHVRWSGVNLPTPPHMRRPGVNLPTPSLVRWHGVKLPTPHPAQWGGNYLPSLPHADAIDKPNKCNRRYKCNG